MIDDLFAELAVDAVDRLLSPETPRDEADFGLARLNSRLSQPVRRDDAALGEERPSDFDPDLEPRLLSQYLQLGVDDLLQVSPRVHEWLLDRISRARPTLNVDALATLTTLYFLFPESTVRYSVVGLMVQSDSHEGRRGERRQDTALAAIWDAIDQDAGISPEDRVDQLQLLAEFLLDYIDLFPEATERTLAALHQGHRYNSLTTHLADWSVRLGGEPGIRVRRAIEETDGPR